MKKPPCIRNLPQYKKGCPQKSWDGEEGCPCWIEMDVATRGNPQQREIKKKCIDLWQFEFQWAMLGLLEGNQHAVESFRNGMCETDSNGKTRPKPNPATLYLVSLLQEQRRAQEAIKEYKIKEMIPSKED